MTHTFRRAVATGALAGAVTTAGLAGALASAQADTAPTPTPTCDLVALTASVTKATADAKVAQVAYTTYTHTAAQNLAAQLKAKEVREAKLAGIRADAAEHRADEAKGPEAKAAKTAAKQARAQARAEAKEAARVQRASVKELRRLVAVERTRLKAAWDAAKASLRTLRAQAEACAETAEPAPPTESPAPTETPAPTPGG